MPRRPSAGGLVGTLVARHVQVIDVLGPGHRPRRYRVLGQSCPLLLLGGAAAGGVPAVQLRQQHAQERPPGLVEPRVVAHVHERDLVMEP